MDKIVQPLLKYSDLEPFFDHHISTVGPKVKHSVILVLIPQLFHFVFFRHVCCFCLCCRAGSWTPNSLNWRSGFINPPAGYCWLQGSLHNHSWLSCFIPYMSMLWLFRVFVFPPCCYHTALQMVGKVKKVQTHEVGFTQCTYIYIYKASMSTHLKFDGPHRPMVHFWGSLGPIAHEPQWNKNKVWISYIGPSAHKKQRMQKVHARSRNTIKTLAGCAQRSRADFYSIRSGRWCIEPPGSWCLCFIQWAM